MPQGRSLSSYLPDSFSHSSISCPHLRYSDFRVRFNIKMTYFHMNTYHNFGLPGVTLGYKSP
jgi:hypothetical protein